MKFDIKKGVNASHWLSQSREKGDIRKNFFTHDDVKQIKNWGFDHIRLPIDEVHLWDENKNRLSDGFALLEDFLTWCDKENLKSIIDFHVARVHSFGSKTEPVLFQQDEALHEFISLWDDLSDFLKDTDPQNTAFEILNEPIAAENNKWNPIANAVHQHLRNKNKDRFILLGSNWYNKTYNFPDVDIPEDDRTILTFHFYDPMFITHYKAPWWNGGTFKGPVTYPGKPVEEESFDQYLEENPSFSQSENKHFDKQSMIQEISYVLDAAKKYNNQIHCGEFGCYQGNVQAQLDWYKDVMAVFNEFDIAWSHWDYKGGFKITENETVRGILTK
jgi:endoglucanase